MQKHTGEYPSNWDEIADAVKDAAEWHCIRCGSVHDPVGGFTLTVHHLDCNKSNCEWWNLAALCQRCHLTIQGKVVMARTWMFEHSEWFRPYVAGYYASAFDYPTERWFCERFGDELIEIGQGRMSAVKELAFRAASHAIVN